MVILLALTCDRGIKDQTLISHYNGDFGDFGSKQWTFPVQFLHSNIDVT